MLQDLGKRMNQQALVQLPHASELQVSTSKAPERLLDEASTVPRLVSLQPSGHWAEAVARQFLHSAQHLAWPWEPGGFVET